MKILVMGILAFLSVEVVHAIQPKIGDSATYANTVEMDGNIHVGRWSKTIEASRPEDTLFLVRWKDFTWSWSYQAWVLPGYIDDLEEFCAFDRGPEWHTRIEEIEVPAGKFRACKVQKADTTHTEWFSDEVPFGLVRVLLRFEDGGLQDQALESFKH